MGRPSAVPRALHFAGLSHGHQLYCLRHDALNSPGTAMFEFFFKYPGAVFQKGQFVLLASWPVWIMALGLIAAGGLLLWHVRRNRGLLTGARSLVIWMLETAMVALLLFLLWHPAISIATLRPQQNVVAVLVDDSHSMGIREGSQTRPRQAENVKIGR